MEESQDGLSFPFVTFTDTSTTYTVSNPGRFINGAGLEERSLDFTVSNPDFVFTLDNDDGTSTVRSGYSFGFTLGQVITPLGDTLNFEPLSITPIIFPGTTLQLGTATVTGNPLGVVREHNLCHAAAGVVPYQRHLLKLKRRQKISNDLRNTSWREIGVWRHGNAVSAKRPVGCDAAVGKIGRAHV